MPVSYISTPDAISAAGLRMTVVSAVPSPWGEAAKGLLHVKGLSWSAVRYNPMDKAQSDWAGFPNAPTLIYNNDAPINGWLNILEFVDAQSGTIKLLPRSKRELCLSLSDMFCGVDGLGWHRRLQGIHAGLTGQGGFSPPIAQYLGLKYGYSADIMEETVARVQIILTELAVRLKAQQAVGSKYFIGDSLTCVDIYSACFMAMFDPLPDEHCAMHQKSRVVFEQNHPVTDHALDSILLAHRDYIYRQYLELPLSL